MNHRERVLAALSHREPDRVPVDFGGTVDSSIHVRAYKRLREHLGFDSNTPRVADVFQQEALVDEDVREATGSDTLSIQYEPRRWRTDVATYGFPVEFPELFRPEQQADGSQVVRDSAGHVELKMPRDGFYFDLIHPPLVDAESIQEIEEHIEALDSYDRPRYLDLGFDELSQRAKALHDSTDYLLVGFFGGHVFQGGQGLRGWEAFLVDLVVNPAFAEALMEKLVELNMRRFERYAKTVGKYVHVIHVEDDLGMQDRPLLSPELYRRRVKPYHKRLFEYIKSRCDARLLLHTDGAVYDFLPDFIEMGVDALNPVQLSAKGMDPTRLKREYGRDISFWGGGCDTQRVLPFGTPADVRDEVRRRVDELAQGGGFIFTQVHNIQADVPPENVVAMYDAVAKYGS
jgi:uroporphyrinogen decarboxylase